MTRPPVWLPILLLVLAPASAMAQDGAAEHSPAQRLFDEARELISRGSWSSACPKLAESHRLEPRGTTVYRLAECYEHVGKTASAYHAYLSASAAAQAAGSTERAAFAKKMADRLEPSLPRLEINILEETSAGLVVSRDGEPVQRSDLETPVPVDPGEHVVSARAPGRQTFSAKIRASPERTTVVMIPHLERLAPPVSESSRETPTPAAEPSEAEQPRRASSSLRGLRPWGIGIFAAGIASATAGTLVYYFNSDDGQRCSGPCIPGVAFLGGGGIVTAVVGAALFFASLDGDSDDRAASAPPALIRF